MALIIGSSSAPPGKPHLRYAQRDAQKMRDLLLQLGRVSPQNAWLLLDPSLARVREALAQLISRARSQGGQKNVLLYYSGHADQQSLLLGKERCRGGFGRKR